MIYKNNDLCLNIECRDDHLERISFVSPRQETDAESPLEEEVRAQLDEYFEGKRRVFELPYRLNGTEFQMKVWQALSLIAYGDTISYRDLAKGLGRAGAARAVGSAMASNPLPIILPCHRVVKEGGKVGSYQGGERIKRYLLKLEKAL